MLEIITKEKVKDLLGNDMVILLVGRQFAEFISGFVHKSEESLDSSIIEIELVYEVTRSRVADSVTKALKKLGHESRGVINDVFYSLQSDSLEKLSRDSEILVYDDPRFMLFESRELYKSFLHALGKSKLDEVISEEEFLRVINRLNTRAAKMKYYYDIASIFERNEVITEFRRVFNNDPLLTPYIKMARDYTRVL